MKKTKNKLFAFGCSYTDPNFYSSIHREMVCDWPKWPEILGKKLGKEIINLGKSGTGNDSMYYKAVSAIINQHEEIDTICILWTNVWRYRIWDITFNPRNSKFRDYENNPVHKIDGIMMKMLDDNHRQVWIQAIYTFLSDFQNLQKLCKIFNIRLVSWCGCSFLNLGSNSKKLQYNMKNLILKWHDAINDKPIDEKDTIDWPFIPILGGNTYSDLIKPITKGMDWYLLHSVSMEDSHPNGKGHELIAETFWEHMK